MKHPDAPASLAGDLLFGAEAIGAFLGLDPRRIYYLAARGNIPVKKIGAIIVGSKRRLAEALTGEECED